VYVIHHKIPYTLGIVFLLPEYSVVDVLKALLTQVEALNLHIRGLYLDKGFCGKDVITFLEDKPYETITDYMFYANKPEAYAASLAVVRTYEKRHGERRAVWLLYVLVNVSTKDPKVIRARYRSRFGIEASYRCMRQTHAMTTSRNPAFRFFLLGVAFLITNLWSVLRWRYCQRPCRGGV
jgi:hypothetical protein